MTAGTRARAASGRRPANSDDKRGKQVGVAARADLEHRDARRGVRHEHVQQGRPRPEKPSGRTRRNSLVMSATVSPRPRVLIRNDLTLHTSGIIGRICWPAS